MGARANPAAPGGDLRRCARCLYDETTPAIVFDERGVCNYCRLHDQLDREYPAGERGAAILARLADRIRAEGRGRRFDVVVGVSGGCDSSYLLHRTVELGLRPLAVHYDNTWNSRTATENIANVLRALGVELSTYVVDNEEMDDIYRAFLRARVPEFDIATDIALVTTLYRAAERCGVRWIFEGHSFRTEGVSPLRWAYMDGKYIESVVRRFGNYEAHRLRTFPNLWFSTFLRYVLLRPVNRIRPLYWMDYHKEEAKRFLTERLGWTWYGGHHLENRATYFSHSYLRRHRYGEDNRVNGFSALVRSGQITRAEGLELLAAPPDYDPEIIADVKERLGFPEEEFATFLEPPIRSFRDFETYKPLFERLRPFFWLMYKLGRVPKSFYVKYTSRAQI